MPRKTVSLSKDAYDALKDEQKPHESFSDTVIRLTNAGDGTTLTPEDVDLIASKTAQEVEDRMTRR